MLKSKTHNIKKEERERERERERETLVGIVVTKKAKPVNFVEFISPRVNLNHISYFFEGWCYLANLNHISNALVK